jgi:hypothetical protein
MFTVHWQPLRPRQSLPPNITSLSTVGKTAKHRPRAVATPSICPCSVVNCSRGNSSWYRLRPSHLSQREPHFIKEDSWYDSTLFARLEEYKLHLSYEKPHSLHFGEIFVWELTHETRYPSNCFRRLRYVV